jgi:hypothetical protein
MKQKITLKDNKMLKQINGKFNSIGCADENK